MVVVEGRAVRQKMLKLNQVSPDQELLDKKLCVEKKFDGPLPQKKFKLKQALAVFG